MEEPEQTRFEIGDFVIDGDAHTVSVRGQALHLTPKEFDLLVVVCPFAGSCVDAQGLADELSGARQAMINQSISVC